MIDPGLGVLAVPAIYQYVHHATLLQPSILEFSPSVRIAVIDDGHTEWTSSCKWKKTMSLNHFILLPPRLIPALLSV